ncbi:hypothetical protein ACIQBJ_06000 [Kitasatospora sp. NPDC088391]|uniref:hypothetical protein n=1 Tax=Kitasatospora sp. NPDC088391 TaxID=3364074 RepID=UPI00381702E8
MRIRTMATAWLVATAAAAGISWAGVNLVLREAVFGPPDAVFVPDRTSAHPGALPPLPGPVPSASRTPGPAPSTGPPTATATGAPRSAAPSPSTAVRTTAAADDSRGYSVRGGQVALALGRDSATLISASPGPGWAVQVWRTDTWLRVDFTKDGRTSSVFATWNGHPPLVETYEQ